MSVLTQVVVADKTSSFALKLGSTEDHSVAKLANNGMIDNAGDSVPKTPASPRQPTRRLVALSPVESPSPAHQVESVTKFTDGAATVINAARKELQHYQLLCDNDFLLWRQHGDYWRVSILDHLEQTGRDLAYIMLADARILRHDFFNLCTNLKDFQNRHGLPSSREAWRELQHRLTTAPFQNFTPEDESQKLETNGATTPTPKEHETESWVQHSSKKTKTRKAVVHGTSSGQQIPTSYWGDLRGLLCYEYNEKGWKLVSAWPDLKAGSRFRKYEGLPNYDQYHNMLRIMYRHITGETKSETRPEPNWKDSEAVAQSMKLAQQSIRRFLGVGSREPRDRYLSQEIDFIADYIRKDVGHDWQHTPENSKHVNELIDAVNAQFEGKRLMLSNGRLSTPRPHRAKFGIINKINRDPRILDVRGKETKPETTKKRKTPDDNNQTGSNKKQKTNDVSLVNYDETSSDASMSINGGHGVQHKEMQLITKNQKMIDVADEDDNDVSTHSEFTDADNYDE